MTHWESWVERQIREAQERGEFDDLPGTGKPLDLGNPDDPDWWVKKMLAREQVDTSQPTHPTLALRREAATYPTALADVRDEAQVREIISDYNRRVVADRRRPVTGNAMPPVAPRLDADEMVRAWRALREEAAADAHESVSSPVARPAEPRRPGRIARAWGRLRGREQPIDATGAAPQDGHGRPA